MDNLATLVDNNQQYIEGLLTTPEMKERWMEAITVATDEDMASLAHLISQFAIHLRDKRN